MGSSAVKASPIPEANTIAGAVMIDMSAVCTPSVAGGMRRAHTAQKPNPRTAVSIDDEASAAASRYRRPDRRVGAATRAGAAVTAVLPATPGPAAAPAHRRTG